MFENPNTSTTPSGDTEPDADTEPSVDELSRIASGCRHACEIERDKLAHAAKTSRNFVAYVDKFYAKAWLAIAAEALPGVDTAAPAERYADARKSIVLEAAGRATDAVQLAASIAGPIDANAITLTQYVVGT